MYIGDVITIIAVITMICVVVWGTTLLIFGKGKYAIGLKLILILLYLSFAGIISNTVNAALRADELGKSFESQAFVGLGWPIVLLAIFIAIVCVQTWLHLNTWSRSHSGSH